MANATTYRTCPRSACSSRASAELLIKTNAVVAVVFLLLGGILAIGVVLTRWPAVHWLEADTFYQVLTAHGIDMLIFWIIFSKSPFSTSASSTLLRCRLRRPNRLGCVCADADRRDHEQRRRIPGGSSVMMTSYVPMGRAVVLSGPDPVRGRRADRLLHLPWHAGRRQT